MTTVQPSGKADRTRRDIVLAAIECWAQDNSGSLGDVATTGGVGRTTVNRYFSNRAELVAAVDLECRSRFLGAVARARPDEGRGLAALLRVCTEIVQLGPVLGLVFADNALVDPDSWTEDDQDPVGLLVVRGQLDGSIAADLPAEWVATTVWTTLFGAELVIRSGAATVHEAGELLSRTLAAGITP